MSFSTPKRSWLSTSSSRVRNIICAIGITALCAVPSVGHAAHNEVIEWNASYTVRENGIVAAETAVLFNTSGEKSPAQFSIAAPYVPARGRTIINNLRIYDKDWNELQNNRYSSVRSIDRINITVNPEEEENSVVHMTYEIIRSINPAGNREQDLDELSLEVLPDDFSQSVEAVRVRIAFPDSIETGSLNWSGTASSATENNEIGRWTIRDNGSVLFSAEDIHPNTQLHITVRWPSGIISQPPAAFPSRLWMVIRYPYYALPAVTLMILSFWFLRYGRDPKSRISKTPRYAPPSHLSPAHLGALVHERVRITFIISMLVDLAQRGYIRIVEESRRSVFSKKDYIFIKRKGYENDSSLTTVERYFLHALFGSTVEIGGQRVRTKLSTLKNHFASKISTMRKMVIHDMVQNRYFRESPHAVRKKYMIIATLLILIALPAWIVGGVIYDNVLSGMPLLITAGLFFMFSPLMPQRTKKGSQAFDHAISFKLFLHHADRYTLQKLNPETFSKYLPYAMIFGIEKSWARAFEGVLKEPPEWYVATGDFSSFSATDFTHALRSSFVHAASQTVKSAPGSNRPAKREE
ncbi:MAG: DUF2207 domain-containing protein [Candidatus Kerfeldbacteria bacterium]